MGIGARLAAIAGAMAVAAGCSIIDMYRLEPEAAGRRAAELDESHLGPD